MVLVTLGVAPEPPEWPWGCDQQHWLLGKDLHPFYLLQNLLVLHLFKSNRTCRSRWGRAQLEKLPNLFFFFFFSFLPPPLQVFGR